MNAGRSYFPIVTAAYTPALGADDFVDLSAKVKVHKDTLKFADFIAPATGVASTFTLAFTGTWAAGETVLVTIFSHQSSPQVWTKRYYYEVQTGDTNTIIATYFKNAIASDGASSECPYSATISTATVTVTAKDNYTRALMRFTNTVTTSGVLTVSAVTQTISQGKVADLLRHGVNAADITLASYDTVRIILDPEDQDHGLASDGVPVKEIYWYGTPGQGVLLETLINSL